jgi:hypothetical protein
VTRLTSYLLAALFIAASWAGCGGDETKNNTGGSVAVGGAGGAGATGGGGVGGMVGGGGAQPCGADEELCDGSCSNILTSRINCGGCGMPCEDDEICDGGTCISCGAIGRCQNECADIMSDTAHCGGCFQDCQTGAECIAGSCVCPAAGSACDDGCKVLGLRFTADPMVPQARFDTLRRELGEAFEAIEIDSSRGNPHGIPGSAHSVVTADLVDEEGHPTRQALERVLGFFRERLLEA